MANHDNNYEKIAKLTKKLLDEESTSFKNRYISMLAELTEEEWRVLENMLGKLPAPTKEDDDLQDLVDVIHSIPDDPAELERMYPPVENPGLSKTTR